MSIARGATTALALIALLTSACTPNDHSAAQSNDQSNDQSADLEFADMVLRSGTVHTMVAGASTAEATPKPAQAVAVRGERIVAVGSDDEINPWIGDQTAVIDLEGATVLPGLIENHGHFLGLGEALTQVDLSGASSFDEIIGRVAAAAASAAPGTWIRGFGWHQEKWDRSPDETIRGFPVHRSLSAKTPNHPVALEHASGHAVLVNQKAMELSGITADSAVPEGGEIILDRSGAPTGLLNEAALDLVSDRAEEDLNLEQQTLARLATAAAEQAAEHGVTTFVDAGTRLEVLHKLAALNTEGGLGVRIWAMIRDTNQILESGELPGQTPWFRVGGIKVSLDGALGSRGAWLLQPYSDAAGETGAQQVSIDSLRRTAEIALQRDLQLGVHAIGDRANRELLDLYEDVLSTAPGASPRWRVEHAQHLHPDDIERFGALGVIASMQGIHCTSDGPWVPSRLGEQRSQQGAYVWRRLIDSGATVVNGTDVPVESIDPWANLAASITRTMANGAQFYPGQAMTASEALASYTRDGAFAIKAEDSLGTIEVGKLADLVVVDQDPLTVDPEQIAQTQVLKTIVGGRIVYRNNHPSTSTLAP